MKIFRNIFIAVAAVLAAACSGNVDDSSLPVLTVSDSEIDLATETQAVFTVTYNGQDVTEDAVIFSNLSTLELSGNVFTPLNAGSATFHAEYNGKESNVVTVDVVDTTPVFVESKYDRHVSVVEFTGAWCINCPEGYDKMKGILAYPQLARYKDNIHICAFHSDAEGDDALAVPETQDLIRLFTGLAYPSFATDLRVAGVLTDNGVADFRPSIEASFNEYKAHCGVAVSSSVSSGMADVTVKVASELTSEYRVVVLVVEDKIKGMQKTTSYPDGQSDYNHRHVVRKVVTEYIGTFTGERLTDDGKIRAGEEAEGKWSFKVAPEWVLANTQIYALVLDSDGYVNNMNLCAVDGGDSGYDMK